MLAPVRQSARPIVGCVARRWPPAIPSARFQPHRLHDIDHDDRRCGARRFAASALLKDQTEVTEAVDSPSDGVASTAAVPPSAHRLATEDRLRKAKKLPITCAGCGAFSQTVEPNIAGFYSDRGAVRTRQKSDEEESQDRIYQQAVGAGLLDHPRPEPRDVGTISADQNFCDRCRGLVFQSTGNSIIHPSMRSIQSIIEESPHKRNHIYHVVDAADFPMSLIPNLMSALRLPKLRTRNRRSNHVRFLRGRTAEVSFIITRSDLLAPKKESVDRMLPYLREVLRSAIGRASRNARLGNVRCVSAHRGWWTKNIKEEIWDRGGAGWMVGKANVGKSALFEAVFPKGRNQKQDVNITRMRQEEERRLAKETEQADDAVDEVEQSRDDDASEAPRRGMRADTTAFSPFGDNEESHANSQPDAYHERSRDNIAVQDNVATAARASAAHSPAMSGEDGIADGGALSEEEEQEYVYDEDGEGSLLPPLRRETAYPAMPVVSSLPGTTASPIRIPFGNSRGELIDLPGVERGVLSEHVQPAFHRDLIMQSRVVPLQHNIKPGQSLLIGGIIRITPKTDDLVFLAYPFVPLKAHVTATEKAIGISTGTMPDGETYDGSVQTIATAEAQTNMKHAGTYKLRWDITKQSAGPLTDKAVGKRRAEDLPFIVYSADLLLEGVGWVEITCQVRNRRRSLLSPTGEPLEDAWGPITTDPEAGLPEIDVWSPQGKFVALRQPMNAWAAAGPNKVASSRQRKRPRQTISLQRRRAGGARGSS